MENQELRMMGEGAGRRLAGFGEEFVCVYAYIFKILF